MSITFEIIEQPVTFREDLERGFGYLLDLVEPIKKELKSKRDVKLLLRLRGLAEYALELHEKVLHCKD